MPSKRDNFTAKTIDILAKRVGYRCSNPNCRKPTCGPNDNPQAYSNIGVAAHICAAAPGGKRYDDSMTAIERKDIHNGIWLCQSCSKLIDSDDLRYTVDILHRWKKHSEDAAMMALETSSSANSIEQDIALIKFYVQCFDRPAFMDDITQEGRMEDFDRAIEDTIIALNTGVLRTRDGDILKQSEGKSFVQNSEWREKLDNIVDILSAIRRRLKIARKDQVFYLNSDCGFASYCFNDRDLAEWFNYSREEVLKILSSICVEVGLKELHFRRRYYRW